MESEPLTVVHDQFIQGMSRISSFWGLPRALGAIFGALYLSPTPLSLDELSELVSVSKGAVSTNVRRLERLGMAHKVIRLGERKDYYRAETDFWLIVRAVLREREQSEFDHALRTVDSSLEQVKQLQTQTGEEAALAAFYQGRLQEMQRFFKMLDRLVASFLALEDLRQGALESILNGLRRASSKPAAQNQEGDQE
ncbi:MAG TPA: hypothetical protein VLS48_00810 [Anaerolineales bacterium]|nr:hypothetical protein [Anaerolineales bacterium]